MPFYRRGSQGPEVTQIQRRLRDLGLYLGPLDGDFGGGTEIAVKAFQRRENLTVDGIVGPETWGRLFPREPEIPVPAVTAADLAYRCLALTGSFETGQPPPDCFAGLSGDFDNQGVSFGALQWNFGQQSLQPLLQELDQAYPYLFPEIFGEYLGELRQMLQEPLALQLEWARSIQYGHHRVREPWRGMFKTLGRRDECQSIQLKYAQKAYAKALEWCREYEVRSERAVALMFDIRVQNGSIPGFVKEQIFWDFQRLGSPDEVARLKIIATRRAEAAHPRWVEDVRARKLTVAAGQGQVHGRFYHLEEQFGIRLDPALT
uniref:Peptidoglycan-binding protein n=1 Tax=Desulfobacca acetoxidans TaxID=60893 RepID=A0A7C3WI03_9BACT